MKHSETQPLEELLIKGISHNEESDLFLLILEHPASGKHIPVVLNEVDAFYICCHLENQETQRPGKMHTLFNLVSSFGIEVKNTTIYSQEDGIYYANICCCKGRKEVKIDSRCSDAIMMALEAGCPLLCTKKVVEECAIMVDIPNFIKSSEEFSEMFRSIFEELKNLFLNIELEEEDEPSFDSSTDEDFNFEDEPEKLTLEQQLRLAVENENYELAAKLRDKLNNPLIE